MGFGVYGCSCVHCDDVDDDGDMDVLAASENDDTARWWENDGNENFTEHIITSNFDGASHVHTADMDMDGDIDVLCVANNADEISWFENDLITSVGNRIELLPNITRVNCFPNPFNSSASISFTIGQTVPVKIAVYNLSGQEVTTLLDNSLNSGEYMVNWNAEGISSGIYFLTMFEGNNMAGTQKVVLVK